MRALALWSFLLSSILPGTTSGVAQVQSYLRNNSFVNFESPQVHPLDLTPDGSKLLAVNTANNSLEVYNTSNTASAPVFVRSIPVGIDPVTVRARTNSEAWVVNVISDSVSIVDLQNGIVTKTLQTGDEPADVVFAGVSQGSAFVSCAQSKQLMVFNALGPTTPIQIIPITGEQPRALATSSNGRYVYLAIFESGNGTTLIPGGVNNGNEHSGVDDPSGPYGGVNPPPNSGKNFVPAVNPSNPPSIPVGLIVKKTNVNGLARYFDDNMGDWTAFITGASARTGTPGDRVAGWDMPDRDVAIIDTGNNYALSYQSSLMNMVMSIGVNPATGNVTVVGTDATNQIRYEPNLQGTFVHVEGASFAPGGANTIFDLNPHITYQSRNVPVAQRQLSIGDPRGIAWNAAGTLAFVTGMGSNNVIVMGPTGARQGLINVGQGPTGIVLDQANNRAFVLNRFDATISTLNTNSLTQSSVTPLHYDPTPNAIKLGRPFLYDTHLNSGLGQLACASCHVDGRTDRLAWDLGNPAGSVVTNSQGISFHPMKGPLLTMTFVDMMQAPFLHWRGDRQLTDFEGAFQTLQGADAPQTDANTELLRAFLGTITLPPNSFRNLDNSYSTAVNMPGPNGTVYTTGNAVLGAQEFENNCRTCHHGETNRGAAFITTNLPFGVGARNPPNWENFYKRMGLWFGDPTASTVGFGFQQTGEFDSTQNQSRDANMYAFMMSMNGGYPYEPLGLNANNWSNNTQASVGKQVTLSPSNPTDSTGLLAQLQTLAGQGSIGLVAKGGPIGSPVRGYMYLGNNLWQSDALAEVDSSASLNSAIASNSTITFTAVPAESAVRIGIDMDSDGILDSDDANPASPDNVVTNLALAGTATASPAYDSNHMAAAAIDGSTMGYYDQNQMYVSQDNLGTNDWWQVDLGTSAQISLIQLFNRWDCCANRLTNVSVFVSQTPFASTSLTATRSQPGVQEFFISGAAGLIPQIPMQTQGRYVRVQLNDNVNALQLAEVRVLGYAIGSFTNPGPQTNVAGTTINLPLTFTNTTSNTYTFSATNLPPGLSINSTTGVISGTLTASTTTTYNVTVTASGPGNPSTSFTWNVPAAATFSVTAGSSTVTLAQGNGVAVPVNVVPGAGFTGTVTLSQTGIPANVGASFYPANPTAGATNLVLYVNSNVTPGTYPVVITGVDGSSTASTNLSLVITGTQTITFPSVASQNTGSTVALSASASSGLPVSYASSTSTVCTVSGSSVTTLAAGTCTIVASQAGNSVYAAATSVSQSFTVTATQQSQTITFGAIPTQTVGSKISVNATASSGLPVTFTVIQNGNCSVSGNVVTMLNAGNCGVVANQAGNASYTAASPVGQIVVVGNAAFTLTPASPTLALARSNGTTMAITVTPVGNFSGTLNYTVSGGPVGASYAFVQTSTAGTTFVIYLQSSTAPGTYNLTITGSSGSTNASTTIALTVS